MKKEQSSGGITMSRLADAAEKKALIDAVIRSDLNCMTQYDLIQYYEENRANELWDYHEDELKEML